MRRRRMQVWKTIGASPFGEAPGLAIWVSRASARLAARPKRYWLLHEEHNKDEDNHDRQDERNLGHLSP